MTVSKLPGRWSFRLGNNESVSKKRTCRKGPLNWMVRKLYN